jgi:tryptophanyl-tRNA synthetase
MRERILTGDRPTGRLHLGHFVGSLSERVKLQHKYEEFILIADIQALTTNFDNPGNLRQDIIEVTMDYLSCGIDPEVVTICVQSMIPELTELTMYFSMFTTVASLSRNPTIRAEAEEKRYGENMMHGFLGYPISQAADITIFRAHLVPVGEDQLPIIEQTREIVRKFNSLYGSVLIEPKALVGEVGRLIGTDGRAKMSKSIGNAIYLSDSSSVVEKKVREMFTDPTKIHLGDKGHPDNCPVHIYAAIFNDDRGAVGETREACLTGKLGCVNCKKKLTIALNKFLEPIREERKKYESRPELITEILLRGTKKARVEARKTMVHVRKAMKIDYFKA